MEFFYIHVYKIIKIVYILSLCDKTLWQTFIWVSSKFHYYIHVLYKLDIVSCFFVHEVFIFLRVRHLFALSSVSLTFIIYVLILNQDWNSLNVESDIKAPCFPNSCLWSTNQTWTPNWTPGRWTQCAYWYLLFWQDIPKNARWFEKRFRNFKYSGKKIIN